MTYPNRPRILPLKKDQEKHVILPPKDPSGDPNHRAERVVANNRYCQGCLWNRYVVTLAYHICFIIIIFLLLLLFFLIVASGMQSTY